MSSQAILLQKRRKLLASGIDIQNQFMDEIDPALLARYSQTKRLRSYPDTLVFWAFLHQVLNDDSSCANAVALVQQWAAEGNAPIPSASTASYCTARDRLPKDMLEEVNSALLKQMDALLPSERRWRGLRPLAEDGTTAQMPDTEANRAQWHYAPGQAEECGFPVIRLNGLICLNHGGLLGMNLSDLSTSELRGHTSLQAEYIGPGDVLVADRLYSGYEVIAGLVEQGAHFIGRVHQSRKLSFREGCRIGPDERLVTWKKPPEQPKGSRLDAAGWKALPEHIEVRIIRSKGPDRDGTMKTRYLATTLKDPQAYPAEEVASLYIHRWDIELRFRDIKTTLGMDMLRTRTPGMVEKEVLMHIIVYNLMRLLMLKAGLRHGVNHRRIGFRGVQQTVNTCRAGFAATGGRPMIRLGLKEEMFRRIAERKVDERPGRNEPRVVKKRPKSSRWLQKPRHQYFEHFRNNNPPSKILDNAA